MKNRWLNTLSWVAAVILLLPGLNSCDNCQTEIGDLGSRIEILEQKAGNLNAEVAALYTIAQAYYNKAEWITGIVEESDGWRISFKSNPDVLIHSGKDGANGHVPQLSIVKDEATGRLCWNIDGTPVLQDGNPLYAEAVDGKPAKIPSFRVNPATRMWEINWKHPYTVESDWTSTGTVAYGPDGDPGEDLTQYIFKSVTVDKELGQVTFVLRDGKTFILPLEPDVK